MTIATMGRLTKNSDITEKMLRNGATWKDYLFRFHNNQHACWGSALPPWLPEISKAARAGECALAFTKLYRLPKFLRGTYSQAKYRCERISRQN